MTQYLLNVFNGIGIVGLFIVMAIEGLSIPFPGMIVALTYGYLVNPGFLEMIGLALGMSLTYCAFSYIPYIIGSKLQTTIKKRFQRKVRKAQEWFNKYGEWSIALTRLLGFGYISYFAGMSKVRSWKFALLTFVGIYVWSFVMLLLGRTFKGNTAVVTQLFQQYRGYLYLALLFIVLGYLSVLIFRRRAKH